MLGVSPRRMRSASKCRRLARTDESNAGEGLVIMKLPRRKFLHLTPGAAALPAVSRSAWAQTYPSRPVRLIVGFGAGSACVSQNAKNSH